MQKDNQVKKYDVVVVGTGPAGGAAANAATKQGLKTLIIEKMKLPRRKSCSGILLPEAVTLVHENIGEIPKAVLGETHFYHSFRFHFDTGGIYDLPIKAIVVNREDFDLWLCKESGADIIDETRLVDFTENDDEVELTCMTADNREVKFKCSVLIGADGARSTVGHILDPLRRKKLEWYTVSQYHFEATVDLEPGEFHIFTDKNLCFFPVAYWKNGYFVVDTNTKDEFNHIESREYYLEYLKSNYGLKIKKIIRKEGCRWAMPAKVNMFQLGTDRVLLAGDAGGFTRMLGEGFTPGLATGLIAGAAADKGINGSSSPGEMYRKMVKKEVKKTKTEFSARFFAGKYLSAFPHNSVKRRVKAISKLISFAIDKS